MYLPKFISEKTFRQTLACFPVFFNQFLIGIAWGWTPPTAMKFQSTNSPFPVTAEQISWIVSINEIGRVGITLVSTFIIDSIGRRNSLVLVAIMTVLIWLSQVFMPNFPLLCMARLVFGMTNGLQDVVAPIYMTENCSAKLRRANGGIMAVLFNVGKCLELTLATYLTYEMNAAVNTAISVCAVGLLYYCVETPQFSIMKGRYGEAEKNLKWLQGNVQPDELSKELQELKDYVHTEKDKKKSVRTLLSSEDNLRGLVLVTVIYLISAGTAGYALGPYIGIIFVSTETLTQYHFLFLSEILNLIAQFVSPLINVRVGSRRLLIVCHLGATFLNFSSCVLMYLYSRHYEIPLYPWLIFITVSSQGLIRSPVGPCLYVLRGELLPLSVRSLGGSIVTTITAVTAFCSIKAFLPITEYLGMEINFLYYSAMSLLLVVVIYFCLPSTPDESVNAQTNLENKEKSNA